MKNYIGIKLQLLGIGMIVFILYAEPITKGGGVIGNIMAEIPKSSKTGYYKMHVCYNFYRTKVIQKYTNGNVAATKYISMPYGESYAAVLYSSSTENGSWSIW